MYCLVPGHSWWLQPSCVVVLPSHFPPFSSSNIFFLVFVLIPPPHELEQTPISQLPHSQSIASAKFENMYALHKIYMIEKQFLKGNWTYYDRKTNILLGQPSVLQSSVTDVSPSQVPPNASSTFFVLVFVLEPPPHVCEHTVDSHSFHSQLIGLLSVKWRK